MIFEKKKCEFEKNVNFERIVNLKNCEFNICEF